VVAAQEGAKVAYFLAKTDPENYSVDDLAREKRTVWDGVRNPQAVRAIREMKPGDKVFLYHSGGESAVVGLAVVDGEPRPDPRDPKSWVAELRFVARLDPPLTLAEIKGSGRFGDWELVRQPRLSTMRAPESFVEWVRRRYPNVSV
jgi:predicted RNA-binding protein with PUA-like domain